jgi:hypothetical protein
MTGVITPLRAPRARANHLDTMDLRYYGFRADAVFSI